MEAWRVRLLFLLILVLPAPLGAQVEALPPDHWAYAELEHFEARGILMLHGMRPYSRRDVSAWVEVLRQARAAGRLSTVESARVARLEDEFVRGESLAVAEQRFDPPLFRLHDGRWGLGFDLEASTGGAGNFGTTTGPESDGTAFARTRFDVVLRHADWAAYDTRYDVVLREEEGQRTDENDVSSRERNWNGLTALDDRGYVAVAGRHLRVVGGREYVSWGSAPDGELLVSSAARSLDALQLQLELGRLRLASVAGWLSASSQRNFAAHRLEVDLGCVRLGVQEAVVYVSPHVEPTYLFPLSFYYGNQFNERADDNTLLGFDVKLASRAGIFDAELLVDDFIYDGDPAPNRLGVRADWRRGVRVAGADFDLSLGYVALGRWVYVHRDSINNYVAASGDPGLDPWLGHPLGPDADRWQLGLRCTPDVRWTLQLGFAHTRRGAGNRDFTPWQPGEPHDLAFPSAPVWTDRRLSLEARCFVTRRLALAATAEAATGTLGRDGRVAAEIRLDP